MRRFEVSYARAAQTVLASHGLPALPADGAAVAGGNAGLVAAGAAAAVRALKAAEAAAEADESDVSGASLVPSRHLHHTRTLLLGHPSEAESSEHGPLARGQACFFMSELVVCRVYCQKRGS